jgi:GTP cyclohydrolase I
MVIIQDSIKDMIDYIGDDSSREGVIDTPKRVMKSWDELYSGYKQSPEEILERTFDSDGYDQLIILRDIEFYSMCEHHMLPFFGKAHVGYIPNDRVVGISKLARLVDCFARRLQIQERLTKQIAEAINDIMKPNGVAVLIEAQHLCMVSRGVNKQNSVMMTSQLLGCMRTNEAREEFLKLAKG